MKPFAIIERVKNDRNVILEKLIYSLTNNNLVLVIINKQPSFFEIFKNKNIKLYSSLFCQIYMVDNEKLTKNVIRYLSNINVWYKPIFHILIGEKKLAQNIKKYLNENKMNIDKMEEYLKDDIFGFIEPLDDDLRIYGKDNLKEIIKKIFPESLQE